MKRSFFMWIGLLTCLLAQATTTFTGNRSDFRDETIYFAMTTRFYDGDPSNNTYCWDGSKDAAKQDPEWRGDFKGLIERLDYIKALGFTAVWITPVVQNASGFDYHGYHAMNMSDVDRRYESDDCKFQDLIDAAHARDMKIVLDIVINHTGNFGEENLCKLFNRDFTKPQSDIDQCMVPFTISQGGKLSDNYLNLPGAQQYSDRLTKMKNTDGVNHDSHNLWHHYGNFNWDEPNRWWAQIAGDCVDLNTENPETYQYLINSYGKFIEMGVDGFRIDTGGHISRLTFNKVFVPAFTALGEQYKERRPGQAPFFMFAEVCARFSDVTYRGQPSLSPYFYTWQSDNTLLNQWNDDPAYWQGIAVYESTDPATLNNQQLCLLEHSANLSESSQPHSTNALLDGNTYHTPDYSQASGMSIIDFTAHWNFQSAGRLWGILDKDYMYNDATYNVMYVESHDYGPDSFSRFNGGTAQWAENLSLMFTMRGIPCLFQGGEIEFRKGVVIDKGTDLALKDTGRAYYGGYITGEVEAADFGEVASASGNVAATLSRPLVHHLQRLNKIRAAIPALRKGQYSKSGCTATSGYAFKRRYTSGDIDSYALITLNSGATFSGVLNGTYRDCITGDIQEVTNGTLTTPAFSGKGNMRIYVLNGPGKIGDDGPFLYTTSSVMPTQLDYDGHEEDGDPNTQYITGGYTPSPEPGNLDVYEPEVDQEDLSVFYEAPLSVNHITTWVWNSSDNFTGGNWPGVSMELMGCTPDSTRKIFKWVYDGQLTTLPTGIIFVVDGTQTNDLTFRNHGYYIDGSWDHEVTQYTGDAPTLTIDTESGYYTDPLMVTITASQSNATIVYTTDGTKPTPSSKTATGMVTLSITDNTILTAGVLTDGRVRNIISREYIFNGFVPYKATVYLKDPFIAPNNWTQLYFYAWDNKGKLLGNWPGLQMGEENTKLVKGDKFYYKEFDITDQDYTFNLIFSQGDGAHQTVDITALNHDVYYEIASTTNKYTVNDITSQYVTGVSGDIDGNGIVDIEDLNCVINIILHISSTDNYPGDADIDASGVIDIEDVNLIVNIILNL